MSRYLDIDNFFFNLPLFLSLLAQPPIQRCKNVKCESKHVNGHFASEVAVRPNLHWEWSGKPRRSNLLFGGGGGGNALTAIGGRTES